ncbi:hypothetical protein PIB30_040682 [Stylosanthes scabra]|uniref:Disease resistance protein winged helix domain-containing protein n=1 Tax=Stylosanthes scabra TaxID=79078 RepID=A0ABU6QF09_9FABA|nr:hypothetical protein [Stylosanthes scabra]
MVQVLKPSYDDLYEEMKPCFLYLGAFPEDQEILVRDLICMWIAEEFIEKPEIHAGGKSKEEAPPPMEPEDIGDRYLKELVDRNLEQVASRRSDDKGVRTVTSENCAYQRNLQTLLYVYADSQLGFLLNNGYFANLRTLGLLISNSQVQLVEENLRNLDRLSKLHKLEIDFETYERVSLGKIAFPSNLTKITLVYFRGFKYEDMHECLGTNSQTSNFKIIWSRLFRKNPSLLQYWELSPA